MLQIIVLRSARRHESINQLHPSDKVDDNRNEKREERNEVPEEETQRDNNAETAVENWWGQKKNRKKHNSTKWRWRMKKQKLGQFDNQRWRRCDDDERLTVRETAKKYTTIISIYAVFIFCFVDSHSQIECSEWMKLCKWGEREGFLFSLRRANAERCVILHSSDNFRGGKWLFNLNKMCFQKWIFYRDIFSFLATQE